MQLMTPVGWDKASFSLAPTSTVVCLGSCFTENMGQDFARIFPPGQVCINPFGVIYDYYSLARSLSLLLDESALPDEIYFKGSDGLWHSWWHSGAFSSEDLDLCRQQTAEALARGRAAMNRASAVFLTLSTSRCQRLKERGFVVTNCHKEPSACFEEEDSRDDVVLALWKATMRRLRQRFPDLPVVFTLSPYRYRKYGMHASQLSKARLLLAIDALCEADVHCHYFPAYEIVLDELRDYRFYKPDMLHPNELATEYIRERLHEWVFSAELREFAAERMALQRDLDHRPLHPESEAYRAFAEGLQHRIRQFRVRWGADSI